ncbi:hypothetical protein CBM2599_B50377 [Cupriavidus taiwanensis]|nr:hypothetical protein CBM2600_B10615 [Cupriavidus taiwanensis]SOY96445.1 hypothetical protein CBM2599_B50377 [Cupriavidus taiwanensis]
MGGECADVSGEVIDSPHERTQTHWRISVGA